MKHLFDLETLTLCLGIIGVVMATWGLVSAAADLNYLTGSGLNGARRIVAVNNLTRSTFRVAVQAVVVVAGIFTTQDLRYAHENGTLLLLCCVVVMSALVVIPDIIDRLRRVQLNRLASDELDQSRIGRRKTDATIAAVCDHIQRGGHCQKDGG